MALDTRERVPAVSVAPRGARRLTVINGGQGRGERVELRVTQALAPILEGIALADDVFASEERIWLALRNGNGLSALHEAGRLSARAQRVRAELEEMAGCIEPRGA